MRADTADPTPAGALESARPIEISQMLGRPRLPQATNTRGKEQTTAGIAIAASAKPVVASGAASGAHRQYRKPAPRLRCPSGSCPKVRARQNRYTAPLAPSPVHQTL